MIDWNKPLGTKKGNKVTLLSKLRTADAGIFYVCSVEVYDAMSGEYDTVMSFSPDGKYYNAMATDWDLVNVPAPPTKYYWCWIREGGIGGGTAIIKRSTYRTDRQTLETTPSRCSEIFEEEVTLL